MARELDPGGLDQICEFVVNILISVKIKGLKHFDVFYLMEPDHWHTLDSLTRVFISKCDQKFATGPRLSILDRFQLRVFEFYKFATFHLVLG